MTTIAIISEYNPFHFGHQYMIEQLKRKYPNATVISTMSGSFVQRGEPAIIDKWKRAESAIESGINLVIELPFYYACQPAEEFAKGAIRLISSMSGIDFLAFGGETEDISPLLVAADISCSIRNDNLLLRQKMNEKYSFSDAKLLLIRDIFERQYNKLYHKYQVETVLRKSNNILAIEYLKNLILSHSTIQPVLISRKGGEYASKEMNDSFSSATAIRQCLKTDRNYNGSPQVPKIMSEKLREFYSEYREYHDINKFEDLIFYLLDNLYSDELSNIYCAEKGFINRILNMRKASTSLSQLTNLCANKGISVSRIQRFYCQLINQLDKKIYPILTSKSYLRVLASDLNGFKVLKTNIQSGRIVISKFANGAELPSLSFEKKVTDNYFSVLAKRQKDMDYRTSPVIRKR